MKKKTIAIALTIALAFTLSIGALAGENDYIATGALEVIPVLGYLGPDSEIVVPEPVPEIYVELPVKIMFAGFEADAGIIRAPVFAITNLSAKNDVKVEIAQFEQRTDPIVDLDGKLYLKLVDTLGEDLMTDLFPGDYSVNHPFIESLPRFVEDSETQNNRFEFTLSGFWSGAFDAELQPAFDMVIKLSAIV